MSESLRTSSGQVSAGYRALHDGAAWLDLSRRGRIRVTGEDRARLLHAMTTQNVQQMQPGDGCYLFFLNAQGRILGDANLFCFADHFLLDTEPETRQKLFEHIDRYIIADDVTLEDVTETLSEISVEGPAAREILAGFGVTLPERDHLTATWGDRVIAKTSTSAVDGFSILLPTASKDTFAAGLGIPQVTAEEARLVRLENGRPRYGEEITERYLVQETGQLQAVNFNKGCYLGQEIVERVRSRAQIHRVLRSLMIESINAPAVGSQLTAGDAPAGEIVNAAFSPALDKVVAMAYVKIPFAEPGTELHAGEWAAKVT
jgi:folate-binding protein YgfZ